MIKVEQGVDSLEALQVLGDLEKQGINYATVRCGNRCVWVSMGLGNYCVDSYYFFRDGKLVDVQFD